MFELKLPDLGEGVVEGEVAKWLVAEGESVAEDQVVLEVMTDKATVEIPTTAAGKVSSLEAQEGDLVQVGETLLKISTDGSSASAASPEQKSTAVETETKTTAPEPTKVTVAPVVDTVVNAVSSSSSDSVQAAPAVRKLARERGIDLAQVPASGPNGRILFQDVENFSANGTATQANVQLKPNLQIRSVPGSREVERIPVRGLRKKIIEKMAESKRTAAHFTCVEECDVTELVNFRNSIKDEYKARGISMTFMPFISKAVVAALQEMPYLNASLEEDGKGGGEIVYKKYYNLGIAVDTPDGLTVPVVPDVDHKNFAELAVAIADVGARANQRKLNQEDFKDCTFTISNAGKVGGLFATPIINYPEVAILGVHEIRKRPMVVNDEIQIRDIMYLSISLDHRVVDGAHGIRFLNKVISYLANPMKFIDLG